MPKKYELLKLTNIMKDDYEISSLAYFIKKLTTNMDLSVYYNTCVFTCLLYSCIYNSNLSFNDKTITLLIIKLHNKIFDDAPLSEDDIIKMSQDINYITKNKLYTKITYFEYCYNSLYNFFFLLQIYVIQE